MNYIKKLAGESMVYGMGTIVPRLLNYLLLTPFYTRILSISQYGEIAELYSYTAFLMVFLTYGMETAFFRYANSSKNSNTAFTTSLISLSITSLLFIGFIFSFAHPIADVIRYSNHHEYIIFIGLIIAIDAVSSIPFARLRHQNKAKKFAVLKIVNVLINIICNFLFFVIFPVLIKKSEFSFLSAVYSPDIGVGYAFISNLIASAVTFVLLIPDIFSIKFDFDKKLLKQMLVYAFPLLIVGVAGMINEVSDKFLLKYLLPKSVNAMQQIGIYGANYKIAVLMTIFIQMFKYAAEPFFFKHADEVNSKIIYADVMKYFVAFGLLIFLGVTIYIDIFKHFIDAKFYSGLKIVPIVLMANLFLGIFYNLSVWYKINNLTKYAAYIALFGAAITIVINFVFIPKFGYMASAWATFICYFIMMIVSFFLGKKFYPIKYDIKAIFVFMASALVIFFINNLINIDNVILAFVVKTILILSFIMIFLFKEKIKLSDIKI
ncbi:MAG: oligosaccharide flippase family protein [Bacteroidetes bacterium]|nr:oligosaccharide flippase family protein [Bacteroidota bacterium]